MEPEKLRKLRTVITENLRVQGGGADPVPYIDVGNVLGDVGARQNHAIFGRRGCGKTLLLQHSAASLPQGVKPIYLNCEDFKKHSFPNVLIATPRRSSGSGARSRIRYPEADGLRFRASRTMMGARSAASQLSGWRDRPLTKRWTPRG